MTPDNRVIIGWNDPAGKFLIRHLGVMELAARSPSNIDKFLTAWALLAQSSFIRLDYQRTGNFPQQGNILNSVKNRIQNRD